jgi:DNA-binding MarR family transcriptional regulator
MLGKSARPNINYPDSDEKLYHLLAQSRYLAYRVREKELEKYKISPENIQLLTVIQTLGGNATPASISRLLLRQSHTVSSMVGRMTRLGMLKKVPNPKARNQVHVLITAKGRKMYELANKLNPVHRILSVLNKKERQNLEEYLERIMVKARNELGLDKDKLPPL